MKPDALINVLGRYSTDARVIVTHPTTFVQYLALDEGSIFGRGVTFALLSVGVVFFVLIPVFWMSGRVLSPDMHELLSVFSVIAVGLLLHISFKAFGGAGELPQTIGVYAFIFGVIAPVHALLMYPTVLKFGPEFVLLTSVPEMQKVVADINPEPTDAIFLAVNVMVSGAIESVLSLVLAVPSLAAVHRVGYARSFLALLTPTLLVALVMNAFT